MSKIIKAFQLTQVRSFDFQEIENEPAVHELPEPGAEPEEEPLSESDPLEDLEALIGKRLEEADRTARQMEKEGYEKGYAEGRQNGYQEGRQAMADTKEQLDRLLLQLQHMPRKIFQDYRGWFIETVLAVARQIVRNELSCRPELLIELIDSLLAEAEKDHNMVLYLNPTDLEAIEKNLEQLEAIQKANGALAIKADGEISQGGCRLESTMQLLDATVETRFSVIRDLLSGHGVKGENGTSH